MKKPMEPCYLLFGARVHQLREALGITQDELRKKVLVRNFGLRPALAQAEIEQHFRGVADGMADLVVSSRADALRAEGNGVVAIQGAAMLRELGRRIIAAEGGKG